MKVELKKCSIIKKGGSRFDNVNFRIYLLVLYPKFLMEFVLVFSRITLLDTAASSTNIGDEIIKDSILTEIGGIIQNAYVTTVSTHDGIGKLGRKLIKNSHVSIILGTNILSPQYIPKCAQDIWQLTEQDVVSMTNKILLLGVGWRSYQDNIDPKQKKLYARILVKSLVHSVRDGYTQKKIAQIIPNVENTICPTMWSLTEEHCAEIPIHKSDSAVFTLTFHKPATDDLEMVNIVVKNYRNISFWPQQIEDLAYLESIIDITSVGINVIPPSLSAFDEHLLTNDCDFIGTRLHGGIRALQKKRRAIIVAIDNRANEITKDTGLFTIKRENIPRQLNNMINNQTQYKIKLPTQEILNWKKQLREFVNTQR